MAYPEGTLNTLNTLNIMSQIHLTMHSLDFGYDSLVNWGTHNDSGIQHSTSKLGKDFAKIIPNWDRGQGNPQTGGDGYPASFLPFEPEFWGAPQHDPKGVSQLESIRGFITALSIHWIEGENVRFDFPSSLVTKDDRVSKGTLMTEADVGIGRV